MESGSLDYYKGIIKNTSSGLRVEREGVVKGSGEEGRPPV